MRPTSAASPTTRISTGNVIVRSRSGPLEQSSLGLVRRRLLRWWRSHSRPFPWRKTRNPFRVLVAEVLLHRTRAEQIVPLYRRFLSAFPSIEQLAAGQPRAINHLLRSAGLRWRVRLMHRMALQIRDAHHGRIPVDRRELEALPGVGPYVAGAVRCFAYGEAEELLDTNTVRIASRVFGLKVTDSSRRSRLFRDALRSLLDRDHPREFNLALLDLAALICRPRLPRCASCPLCAQCEYGKRATLSGDPKQ